MIDCYAGEWPEPGAHHGFQDREVGGRYVRLYLRGDDVSSARLYVAHVFEIIRRDGQPKPGLMLGAGGFAISWRDAVERSAVEIAWECAAQVVDRVNYLALEAGFHGRARLTYDHGMLGDHPEDVVRFRPLRRNGVEEPHPLEAAYRLEHLRGGRVRATYAGQVIA